MPETTARIAILAPMPNELAPVLDQLDLDSTGDQGGFPVHEGTAGATEIIATRTGIGPKLAEEATERVLASSSIDCVVVTGIAGGVAPVTAVGDLVVPEEVVDSTNGERFRSAPVVGVVNQGLIRTGDGSDYGLDDEDIARLRGEGVVALDMETAAVARVCDRHGVPWVAFRAISDMAGNDNMGEVVMKFVHEDGTPDGRRALLHLLTHPWQLPRIVRLGRDANSAATIAATAAVRFAIDHPHTGTATEGETS